MNFNRIAFAALWLLVFVLPWELFYTFPGLGTAARLGGMIALGVGLLDVALRGRPRRLGGFHLAIALFVVWAGLSLWWTIHPEGTTIRFKTYAQLALLVWLLWEFAPTPARQHSLMQAYVLGAYVSVLDTVLSYLAGTQVATGRFAASGFNPNDLGFTLVLALPLAWYLSLTARHKVLVWVNRLYVPLGMAAILLTASRGSFIPAVAALIIVPWTMSHYPVRTRVAVSLLVVASLIFFRDFIPQSSWRRLSTIRESVASGDLNYRVTIWKAGSQVFMQHPMKGVGAGSYAAAVGPILGVERAPHQTFLSVAVGQGLIGLALFLLMFLMAFRNVPRMPPLTRKLWMVMALTLAVGLQSRTWDYRKPLWFVLGILAVQTATVPREPLRIERRAEGPPTRRRQRAWRSQRVPATTPVGSSSEPIV